MNGNKITQTEITSEFLRLCPWATTDYTQEDIMRGIETVTKLVGVEADYNQAVSLIEIKNSEGTIPSDAYVIKALAATNAINLEDADAKMKCKTLELYPVTANMDKFNRGNIIDNKYQRSGLYKAILNNSKVQTNFEQGVVALAYTTLLSEDGELAITNNKSWLLAVVWEVAATIANRLYITDKMSLEKLKVIMDYRSHYCSQSGNASRLGNILDRQAIKNNNLSHPKDMFPENTFYANLGRTFTIKYI